MITCIHLKAYNLATKWQGVAKNMNIRKCKFLQKNMKKVGFSYKCPRIQLHLIAIYFHESNRAVDNFPKKIYFY